MSILRTRIIDKPLMCALCQCEGYPPRMLLYSDQHNYE